VSFRPRSKRFCFELPSAPCLVSWSRAGPGHWLGADALTGADADAAVRDFIRDTWDAHAAAA
jgi:hypothetical protein